ncbi:MAG: TIGR04002 family protein [Clostridia bacterium]|nr:TIGR04002 family protein [Clostridia bacterium]
MFLTKGVFTMQENRKTLKRLTLGAMFAALTAVTTAYIFHIPMAIFGGQGYVHVGDAVIFLAASCLPTGYACAVGALGGAAADLLSGAALWAPWTFIIKALVALCFSAKQPTLLHKRNYLAVLFAALISIGGYYVAEGCLYGNWIAPVYSIIGNLVQAGASTVLYLAIGFALDRINIKKQLSI